MILHNTVFTSLKSRWILFLKIYSCHFQKNIPNKHSLRFLSTSKETRALTSCWTEARHERQPTLQPKQSNLLSQCKGERKNVYIFFLFCFDLLESTTENSAEPSQAMQRNKCFPRITFFFWCLVMADISTLRRRWTKKLKRQMTIPFLFQMDLTHSDTYLNYELFKWYLYSVELK